MDRSFRGIRFDEHSFESFVIGVIFVELVERGTCIQFFSFEFLLEELFYSTKRRMFGKMHYII